MNLRLTLAIVFLFIPIPLESQDNCGRCDCNDYPLKESFCVACCFTQKGTVTSTSPGSVTIVPVPSTSEPKPIPQKFKIDPHTKIERPLKTGKDATVYFHRVNGQAVATRIDLSDYVEGQLTPDTLPAPHDNYCVASPHPPFPESATMVLFGVSGAVAFSYPFVPLQINKEDVITIQRTSQGMLVSAKLYDSQGKLAAQIIDNHFFVKVRVALHLDHSDPHSLRILDGNSPLVEIEFINPTMIRILGTIYGPGGTHLDISKDEMKVNGHGSFRSICLGGGRVGIAM